MLRHFRDKLFPYAPRAASIPSEDAMDRGGRMLLLGVKSGVVSASGGGVRFGGGVVVVGAPFMGPFPWLLGS